MVVSYCNDEDKEPCIYVVPMTNVIPVLRHVIGKISAKTKSRNFNLDFGDNDSFVEFFEFLTQAEYSRMQGSGEEENDQGEDGEDGEDGEEDDGVRDQDEVIDAIRKWVCYDVKQRYEQPPSEAVKIEATVGFFETM